MDNSKEKDYYLISNLLPAGVLIFATVIILGLIFIKKPELEYKITTSTMLEKVLSHSDLISPDKIMDILFENDTLYRFIDLRSAPDFLKDHLEGAVNIPIDHILDKKYQNVLNQDEKINVLYYSDHCGACGPWMILSQLGYKNNKILLGGYDYVTSYILNDYAPLSGEYQNEKARYNFSKIINETSGGQAKSLTIPQDNTPQLPIKKKKKDAVSSGGC